jgi:hypothetical protein
MAAVIRPAEARRKASTISITSMRLSLVGVTGGLQHEDVLAAHVFQ